jgi:hypothetical protein
MNKAVADNGGHGLISIMRRKLDQRYDSCLVYGSDCAENERDVGTFRPELFLSEITR